MLSTATVVHTGPVSDGVLVEKRDPRADEAPHRDDLGELAFERRTATCSIRSRTGSATKCSTVFVDAVEASALLAERQLVQRGA
jgi:hypothetical protein